MRVTEEAIQILGGYGYTREYPSSAGTAMRRSTRSLRGTSEIQQLVIARAISGMRIE